MSIQGINSVKLINATGERKATKIDRVIRMRELLEITSLSRATVYRMVSRDKNFPKPIKIGNNNARNSAVGFLLADVQRWIEEKAKQCPT